MNTRILHCSNSIDNYFMCLDKKVAGFTNQAPKLGDKVYLAVKINGRHFCSARFEIGNKLDIHPWNIKNKKYFSFQMENIEYCIPFELNILAEHEPWWLLKYFIGSKPIVNNATLNYLSRCFEKNKTQTLSYFN